MTREDARQTAGSSPFQRTIAHGAVTPATRTLASLPFPPEGPCLSAILEEEREADYR